MCPPGSERCVQYTKIIKSCDVNKMIKTTWCYCITKHPRLFEPNQILEWDTFSIPGPNSDLAMTDIPESKLSENIDLGKKRFVTRNTVTN